MSDIQAINLDEEEYERIPRELPKDIELNLSVFRTDYKWTTWRGFWSNIADWFRSWNVDYTLTAYLIKVLIEYRNVTNGWPFPKFKTFEEWIAAIDQCIDWLIFSAEDPDKLNKYWPEYKKFLGKGPKNWTEEEHAIFDDYVADDYRVYEMQCEARKKAFAFLGEYLPHIWW